MSLLFASGGQSIDASTSASVLPTLIFFTIDRFDLLAVQGTLKSLLQHHSSKASILRCSAFFTIQLSQGVFHNLAATQEVPRHTRLHSRGSTRVPPTSRGAPFPPPSSTGGILSLRVWERIPHLELQAGNGAPLDVAGTLVLPLEWRRVCQGTS